MSEKNGIKLTRLIKKVEGVRFVPSFHVDDVCLPAYVRIEGFCGDYRRWRLQDGLAES